MKVWLLTNTPSPYQVEFFRALSVAGIDLEVRFMRLEHRGEMPLEGSPGFRHAELRGLAPRSWRDEVRLHPEALKEVRSGGFDLYVLSGHYTSVTFLLCAWLLKSLGKSWAVWLEQPKPEYAAQARSPASRAVRGRLLPWVIRSAPKVFCIGTAAVDAYEELGAPREKLLRLPYFCDVSRFRCEKAERREKVEQRDRSIVFLFSGQLIERKGVDVLLAAFERLVGERPNVELTILGDGPLGKELRRSAAAGPAARKIHFAGHLAQSDMPVRFAAADVFVFPSRHDGWGVVLNEACGAGLPIITTQSVGAARDLVADGTNGFIVDRDDVDGLLHKMRFFVDHPEEILQFGRRSSDMADRFNLAAGVDLFRRNCEAAIEGMKTGT